MHQQQGILATEDMFKNRKDFIWIIKDKPWKLIGDELKGQQ